jgi:ribonucleoside-diphosphate reductase beta chain
LATERGRQAYKRNKDKIKKILDEVTTAELVWTDYLFSEGRELLGATPQKVKEWALFNAKDVYTFLDIESDFKFPKNNPMPNLEKWIDINLTQAAPQEQDNNQYKVNLVVRDDEAVDFDVDF